MRCSGRGTATLLASPLISVLDGRSDVTMRPPVVMLMALLGGCGTAPRESTHPAPKAAPASVQPSASTVCGESPSPARNAARQSLEHVIGAYRGEGFVMGVCVLEVPIDVTGQPGEVRFLRPHDPSPQLVKAVLEDTKSWRFHPATACGRAVPSTLTMTITHCPVHPDQHGSAVQQ
jgi:TonB-like protein